MRKLFIDVGRNNYDMLVSNYDQRFKVKGWTENSSQSSSAEPFLVLMQTVKSYIPQFSYNGLKNNSTFFPTAWLHNWRIRASVVQAKQATWARMAPVEMWQVSFDQLFNGAAYETHDLSCSRHPLLTLTKCWPKKHVFVPMTSNVWGEFIIADMTRKMPFREFSTPTHAWKWKDECLLLPPAGFPSPPLFDVLCPWRKWTILHCQRTLEPLRSAIGATTFIILTKGNKQLPQRLTAFSHLQILE